MTPAEASIFEHRLTDAAPATLGRAIIRLHEHPLRGEELSIGYTRTGDATLAEVGFRVRELVDGRFSVRLTQPAGGGMTFTSRGAREAYFDEWLMTATSLDGFSAALVSRLRGWGVNVEAARAESSSKR